jgi:hypothetical protein
VQFTEIANDLFNGDNGLLFVSCLEKAMVGFIFLLLELQSEVDFLLSMLQLYKS